MERSNFYFLLTGIMILLVVEPLFEGTPKSGALIQLAYSVLLVVGVFSLAADRRLFSVGLGFAAIGLTTSLAYVWTGSPAMRIVDLLAILLFCLLSIGVVIRQVVFSPGPITTNRLAGSLCIYLLLGVAWSILFTFVELAVPDAFLYASLEVGDPLEGMLYYSFVTLTTLGFGDITPLHPVARRLSTLEAVIGQIYIAVLIGSLVGRRLAERPIVTGA